MGLIATQEEKLDNLNLNLLGFQSINGSSKERCRFGSPLAAEATDDHLPATLARSGDYGLPRVRLLGDGVFPERGLLEGWFLDESKCISVTKTLTSAGGAG